MAWPVSGLFRVVCGCMACTACSPYLVQDPRDDVALEMGGTDNLCILG